MATEWHLVTCRCVLQYDGIDANGQLVNLKSLATCADHAASGTAVAIDENLRVSKAIIKAHELLAGAIVGVKAADIGWRYDVGRRLLLKAPATVLVPSGLRAQIDNALRTIHPLIELE
jgi:hypothetical protein